MYLAESRSMSESPLWRWVYLIKCQQGQTPGHLVFPVWKVTNIRRWWQSVDVAWLRHRWRTCKVICWKKRIIKKYLYTVDSRYLEFDGTMEKIRVNRSSTQEELRRYRKCGLFNNERETTRAKFWRAKTSIACPYSRNDFKHIRYFCCCFFLSVKFFESCETTDNF